MPMKLRSAWAWIWPGAKAALIGRLLALALVVVAVSGCGKKSVTAPLMTGCPDEPGVICTWAGTGQTGFDGDGNTLLESSFYWPIDITVASNGDTYVLDWNNHRVRRVTAQGTFQTVIGTDFVGDGPLDLSDLTAPGAPGTEVNLNHPTHLVPLSGGTYLLVAWHNHKLRTYDPATGLVVVICGAQAGFGGDGGPAKDALLSQPCHAVEASDGGFYILDQRNQRVRKIGTDGIINTVVGTGAAGFSGDGGAPLLAEINQPAGGNPQPGGALALDAQGRLYFSDVLNHRIRRVDFAADRIETIAGNGTAGFAGDEGPATQASLNNPRDIEIGPDGRLYIADEFNHRVRVVDLTTGVIATVAGTGVDGFSGDGGAATAASLNRPQGIAFDTQGRLYIADTYNQRIRRVRL